MSSRFTFWQTAAVLAVLVLIRAFPFVWWPATHFDSDQAIVGLMAKHISEGQAFPLYFYGQNYMLAVEAYLAAPVMWVMGPTVTALKTPLVLINIAAVVLLLRLLIRDARLPAWLAGVSALPLALPAAGVAARVTEANGGNVEPFLYVLLLWTVRRHPGWLGLVLGVGMLHREFAAYGAAALVAMECVTLITSRLPATAVGAAVRHWTLAGVTVLSVRAVAAALRPFANGLGPGTRGDDAVLVATMVETVGGRVCFSPDTWPTRALQLVGDHLPRLVGGTPAPLRDYGVLTGVYSGQPGLGLWVGLITLVGLTAGTVHWWHRRQTPDAACDHMPHLGGYLVLVGAISTFVYGFALCSDIRVETMRYNLLGVLVPIGALTMTFQTWRAPLVRAAMTAAVVLWCLVNTLDVAALTREYRSQPPEDPRAQLVEALEREGVTLAFAQFRTAYHTTFLARERVRIAATDFSRIRAYVEAATAAQAPTLSESPCDRGQPLTPGLYLCR
jgi:hypothetical protein